MDIAAFNIVRSVAGRDRGKLFVVLAAEEEYLLLAERKIQEGGVAQTQKAQTRAVCRGGREPAF